MLASRERRADELWCLGDLVGYGPQPNRCVEEVRDRAAICLIGNHDLACRACGPRRLLGDAARERPWTRTELEPERGPSSRRSSRAASETGSSSSTAARATRCGSTSLSEAAARRARADDGAAPPRRPQPRPDRAQLSPAGASPAGSEGRQRGELGEGRWLLNPGSVGQPRDGDPRAAYLLLDRDTGAARFRRLPYPIETQAEIREHGLPEPLATRLADGE